MSSVLTWIGHWHPVWVHLPIGVLLSALLLQVLASRPAYAALRPAVPVVLLAGVVSAFFSCMTGWLLSLSGDYDASLVGWHMWMGISLSFLSFFLWTRVRVGRADRWLWVVVLLLVIVTGHLGGSLTHGSDYLSFNGGGVAEVDSPIVNVQEARAYAQIVRPIVRDNCYSCHGASRQKGGLRLDDSAALFRGGKDGVVVLPGRGGASEMIKRLLLPEGDEHHMPPREKRPLNSRETMLLRWWIDQGADLSRRVAELKQPDSVRPALLSVQGILGRGVSGRGSLGASGDVPAEEVEAADGKAVEALRSRGVLVMEVARGSHWLEMAAPAGASKWVRLLLPVKKQLLTLKAGYAGIGDSAMSVIGQCGALRSLDLSGNAIGDTGVSGLKGLHELRVLNLVGTRVSAKGIAALKGLPKLRTVYLYKTRVGSGDWVELKREFPKVELDTGGYSMPVLETDTAVVRQGKRSTSN